MRRRVATLLLALLVVIPAVPATAAEPDRPAIPQVDANPAPPPIFEPTPTPTTEPIPVTRSLPTTDPVPVPAVGDTGDVVAPGSSTPTLLPTAEPRAAGGLDATGRYIVVLRSGSDTNVIVDRHAAREGLRVSDAFSKAFRGFAAKLDSAQRRALAADPHVVAMVPDEVVHLTSQTVPTGVARIGGRTSPIARINGVDERVDADVAIVDTGVALHDDLNVAGGYNCSTTNTAAWGDDNGHGTHVAGTVAAIDNSIGVVGVAPGARIWAVKILNGDGYGLLSWYVCGLEWILAQRDPDDSSRPLFEAVNMSVAKEGHDDLDCGYSNNDVLHQSICRLVAAGITVVAAAANDHASAAARVPAAYNEVITVSALADTDGKPGGLGGNRCYSWGGYDKDDTFADFSNYGSDVDLIAPGKCIWSTKPGNSYQYLSGTSMAAPAVTGAVALYKSSRPYATPAEVKEALQYLGNLGWKTSTDPDHTHERLLDVSRLGPLGTFSVSTLAATSVGEAGGTTSVPIRLTRSSSFFERVRLNVSGLPSGWSASLDSTSLIGWTSNSTTVRVTAPRSTPSGTYPFTVTATNQGRADSTTGVVNIQNVPPVARAAAAVLLSGATLGLTTAPIKVTWPAATDNASGIAGYEVQVREDGGPWVSVALLPASARSITRQVRLGSRVDIQVRARDGAGNWSPWVTTSLPFQPTALDDRSGALHYSSGWSKTVSAAAIGHSLHATWRRGASVTSTFVGRGVSVVAPTGPGRATITIRIDGRLVRTVSLRTSTLLHRRILYAGMLANGTHHITIQSVSSGVVQLDALVIAK